MLGNVPFTLPAELAAGRRRQLRGLGESTWALVHVSLISSALFTLAVVQLKPSVVLLIRLGPSAASETMCRNSW
jgi:hypothetical protein